MNIDLTTIIRLLIVGNSLERQIHGGGNLDSVDLFNVSNYMQNVTDQEPSWLETPGGARRAPE